MKKRLFSLILALCVFLTAAFAAPIISGAEINYKCGDNLTWSLDTQTGEFAVSGTGLMYDFNYQGAPWYSYASYIKTAVIGEGVTYLGDYAFSGCTKMTSLSLPSTLLSLGGSVLYNTSSLTGITFPSGSSLFKAKGKVFNNCAWYNARPAGPLYIGTLLYEYKGTVPANTSLTVQDGTLGIQSGIFKDCTNLVDISVPDSVFAIGRYAFDNTSWLNMQPDGAVFAGKVLYKYKGTMNLGEELILPDGTTGIAGNALNGCDLLEKLTIPDSVIFVGTYAFSKTDVLKSLILPSGLKYIEENGFDGCGATSIILPSSVEYMENAAFRQCDMKSFTFADGFKLFEINEYMFDSSYYLESIIIPNGVLRIGKSAFWQCFGLKAITIPASVTSIASDSFKYSGGQNNITISCYENSAAHTYAVDNGFSYILLDGSQQGELDTAKLTAAQNRASLIARSLYTAESLTVLDSALSQVDLTSAELTQQQIDEWAAAITAAVDNLKYIPADYYAVENAQASAASVDRTLYTEQSLGVLDAALDSVISGLDITNQVLVNSYAHKINSAIDALQYAPADYSRVNELVNECGGVDRNMYSSLSLTVLDQAVSSVVYGLDITRQEQVNSYAASLAAALGALQYDSVVLRNEPHGVIVSATTMELDKGSALAVDLKDPSDYEGSNFAVGGTIKNMYFYDINIIYDSQPVQPDGTVTVKIKLPDGVSAAKCKVYHVTSDLVDPLVRYVSTIDGEYIVFETDHFSEFAIIEVETVLSSLTVNCPPDKTQYRSGDPLSLAGLEVCALFSDGTSKSVYDFELSMVDLIEPGEKTVRVYYTYGGITKSASFKINIEASDTVITVTNASLTSPGTLSGGSSGKCILNVNDGASNYTVKWSSSDPQIAAVDQNGTVTATGSGTATITAEIRNSDGSVVTADTQVSCKMTFFQRIVLFFRRLFKFTSPVNLRPTT